MQEQLREACRRLLEEGTVQVVIGYGEGLARAIRPVFITRPEDVARLVWNDRCAGNLVTYLTRKEIRRLGKAAIVVKPCDERALVVLEKESQLERAQLVVIGMVCQGVGRPPSAKCAACDAHAPRWADIVIGDAKSAFSPGPDARFAAVEKFLEKSTAERLDHWRTEFARCVKCYACRQACPLCYCERCIVDKNRPTVIDTSATLQGTFAWHITRAFHLAGRCIGCDECTRACPAGIDLRLLNQSLARTAETQFSYRPGVDADVEPIVGAFAAEDAETFIR